MTRQSVRTFALAQLPALSRQDSRPNSDDEACLFEGVQRFARFHSGIRRKFQCDRALQRLSRETVLPGSRVCETEMVAIGRIVGILTSEWFEKGNRRFTEIFLVIDPGERIAHAWVIGELRLCCLCELQCDVELLTLLGVHPRQIVGRYRRPRVDFQNLLILGASLLRSILHVQQHPDERLNAYGLWSALRQIFELARAFSQTLLRRQHLRQQYIRPQVSRFRLNRLPENRLRCCVVAEHKIGFPGQRRRSAVFAVTSDGSIDTRSRDVEVFVFQIHLRQRTQRVDEVWILRQRTFESRARLAPVLLRQLKPSKFGLQDGQTGIDFDERGQCPLCRLQTAFYEIDMRKKNLRFRISRNLGRGAPGELFGQIDSAGVEVQLRELHADFAEIRVQFQRLAERVDRILVVAPRDEETA